MTLRMLAVLAGMLAWPAWTQIPTGPPEFSADSVLPSGHDRPTALAPGMLVSIYGHQLGPVQECLGQADTARLEEPSPLRLQQMFSEQLIYPTELCGVRVLFGGEAAGLLYVGPQQINFKVPQSSPVEGAAEVQVIRGEIASEPVSVKLGLEAISLALTEHAYPGMPIWLQVSMPFGWHGTVRYPFGVDPSDMGCNEVEVRFEGKTLAPRRVARSSPYASTGCWLIGLPGQPKQNRIPLHVLYQFEKPGTYEVRFTASREDRRYVKPGVGHEQVLLVRSEWTPLEVRPADGAAQRLWLAEMRGRSPMDPTELVSDYLPGLLAAAPAEEVLPLFAKYLYHGESVVQQFAGIGLNYWSKVAVDREVARRLREEGPSEAATNWVAAGDGPSREEADRFLLAALPYLQANSEVSLRGALDMVRQLALWKLPGAAEQRASDEARVQAEEALIAAADHFAEVAGPQTRIDFAAALGQVRDERAREVLWQWVEGRVALGQALSAITWKHRTEDLPRLGTLLAGPVDNEDHARELWTLAYSLRNGYGDAAIPYLEEAATRSPSYSVRRESAKELIFAGRPLGFAFALEVIEKQLLGKGEIERFLRDHVVGFKEVDDEGLRALLQERTQVR